MSYRIFDRCFKHELNPDGSTRTECLCVFPGENRKCQFVAVRDPGGHLRYETLSEHLKKHHKDVLQEMANVIPDIWRGSKAWVELMNKRRKDPDNSSNMF
ncbi:hypothetical protein DdX_12327 [Ditylenchus destructor]|uniref:Uncharacterized protein n=1 Tax=Ditylenchus destructor TaxID=166010 RepID=A0AAD4R0K7_9BILA|nr:hypothetical protein DdX_12327 [Ditylenchus destructor]